MNAFEDRIFSFMLLLLLVRSRGVRGDEDFGEDEEKRRGRGEEGEIVLDISLFALMSLFR